MPGPARDTSWWNDRRDLHALLQRFPYCQASNDLDKIYTLFGLVDDPIVFSHIQADYNRSLEEVIANTTLFILGLPQDLLPAIELLNLSLANHRLSESDLRDHIWRRSCSTDLIHILKAITDLKATSDALWILLQYGRHIGILTAAGGIARMLVDQYNLLPNQYPNSGYFISPDDPVNISCLTQVPLEHLWPILQSNGFDVPAEDCKSITTVSLPDFIVDISRLSPNVHSLHGDDLVRIQIKSKPGVGGRADGLKRLSEIVDAITFKDPFAWPFLISQVGRRDIYFGYQSDGFRQENTQYALEEALQDWGCGDASSDIGQKKMRLQK